MRRCLLVVLFSVAISYSDLAFLPPRRCRCRFFAVAAMFVLNLQMAVMRAEAEVEGLRRQLDNLQAEGRGLRQAALDDAAADAAARRELVRKHRVELAAAVAAAKAEAKEEREAAVAAAKVDAREAERDRLRASVGPVLSDMQLEQERLLREVAVAAKQREALEAELSATRQLVFDALTDPAELRIRMGF